MLPVVGSEPEIEFMVDVETESGGIMGVPMLNDVVENLARKFTSPCRWLAHVAWLT